MKNLRFFKLFTLILLFNQISDTFCLDAEQIRRAQAHISQRQGPSETNGDSASRMNRNDFFANHSIPNIFERSSLDQILEQIRKHKEQGSLSTNIITHAKSSIAMKMADYTEREQNHTKIKVLKACIAMKDPGIFLQIFGNTDDNISLVAKFLEKNNEDTQPKQSLRTTISNKIWTSSTDVVGNKTNIHWKNYIANTLIDISLLAAINYKFGQKIDNKLFEFFFKRWPRALEGSGIENSMKFLKLLTIFAAIPYANYKNISLNKLALSVIYFVGTFVKGVGDATSFVGSKITEPSDIRDSYLS